MALDFRGKITKHTVVPPFFTTEGLKRHVVEELRPITQNWWDCEVTGYEVDERKTSYEYTKVTIDGRLDIRTPYLKKNNAIWKLWGLLCLLHCKQEGLLSDNQLAKAGDRIPKWEQY